VTSVQNADRSGCRTAAVRKGHRATPGLHKRVEQTLFSVALTWFLFLLSACAVEHPDRSPATPHLTPSIPVAGLAKETAVPTAFWELAPEPGTGNIRGCLVITSSSALVGELYLAATVPTSEAGVYALELNTETAPRAVYDRQSGRFAFANVLPGKYGIIAWEPMSSAPIANPETGDTIFVEVVGGATADLGTLTYP